MSQARILRRQFTQHQNRAFTKLDELRSINRAAFDQIELAFLTLTQGTEAPLPAQELKLLQVRLDSLLRRYALIPHEQLGPPAIRSLVTDART